MSSSDDPFELDVRIVDTANSSTNVEQPDITSVSLCTPGCITGVLETCFIQTATCNCVIG